MSRLLMEPCSTFRIQQPIKRAIRKSQENALAGFLKSEWSASSPGQLDRYYSSFVDLVALSQANVHFVARKLGAQKSHFNRGIRLGKNDHRIELSRPRTRRPRVSLQAFRRLPQTYTVRGFRPKNLDLVTSLLDPKKYPREEIARLFLERWNVEVDFRILKSTLKMDVLHCKSPEMIQKEIWAPLFGYNIVRLIMIDGRSSVPWA